MKVLADGALAGSAEEAIRQAVTYPYAHSATIGFRDEHQIDMAVRIAEGKSVAPGSGRAGCRLILGHALFPRGPNRLRTRRPFNDWGHDQLREDQ